ncbi:MAG: DUF131 domain-containing protein [Candidatus Thorarchaeota archaeon]
MLQLPNLFQLLGIIIAAVGVALIALGVVLTSRDTPDESRPRPESKGVIFIGPIPIVWGLGRRGCIVAGLMGIVLFLLWVVIFL